MDTHKEIIAKLDYEAPSCPDCGSLMKKYDFQKPSKIPYLETTGMPSRILLRKRRFKCYHCSKMMVAETPLVKKNHQIPRIINQKIAQKLIEKISMTDIAHQLAISTSTVIRKLNDFHFEHDFSRLPKIMSWDEYAFTKGKMSFIAQDFDNLNIITVLEGRTQAVIRNHFLRYDRAVRCQVKIITMDMFSPYYDLAKQLFPCAKIVLDRFHIIQHLSRAMSRFRVQIMNQFERKSHEYKAIKRYWKLIQQDSRKLSDKRFYRPTFRMHLTNKEILDKILSYSEDLKHHGSLMKKYDFQKPSKIPYLETTGMPTRILLRKRRFKCYHCSKMMVAETPLVKKNHQIPRIINQKIAQKLIEKISMTDIAHQLAISTSTVIRKLNDFHFEHDFSRLPKIMSWDEYAFTKGKMSFIAQDFDNLNIITVLEGRTQAVIRNHFLRYDRAVRCQVKIITMDMFSPYYDLAKQLFPCAKIVLDRFHIIQHLSRAMSRFRVQIMNQFERKSHEYKAIKRYWKLIQQDSRKLSDKRFYRPTFRMHLTNKEILDKILSYSEDLKHHYQIYQLLLFHFQNKDPEKFFGLIEDNLKQVHPIFQTVFKTFLKNKEKIVNALQLPYSNAKLEATNNLIKLIKRNAFGFRNFENFKKRIFIALNIKKERTKFVLSRA
ncbi:ISL3 family transposase [Streptococcus pneumoniae]|nr:ISL3 family transposase [Streptococcus pneumoniae]